MAISVLRRLDFSEVPVIDMAPLLDGGSKRHQPTIDAVDRACSEVGFMYVKNHGVPEGILKDVVEESMSFFALAPEVKGRVNIAKSPIYRGYLPLRYHGAVTKGGNHSEGYVISRESAERIDPLAGLNQWPEGRPKFKSAVLGYFSAAERLAHILLPCFAQTLGIDAARFMGMFDRSRTMMNLAHYPLQDSPEDLDQIGVRPHSDFGALTVLWQDRSGGLEVQNRNGEWVEVPPIEGTYVINIGDMLQTWSNGHFVSTQHRVINRYARDRYSVPLFINPNYDVVVEPLVGQPEPDFVPYLAGKYMEKRLNAIYPHDPVT
jgi:isopenicillin N synthase-like dioxygenase